MTPLIAAAFAAVPRDQWAGAPLCFAVRRDIIAPMVEEADEEPAPEAPAPRPPAPRANDERCARLHALRLEGVPWDEAARRTDFRSRPVAIQAYQRWCRRTGTAPVVGHVTPDAGSGATRRVFAARRARVVEAILAAGGPPGVRGVTADGFWRRVGDGLGMTAEAVRMAWVRAQARGEVPYAAAD